MEAFNEKKRHRLHISAEDIILIRFFLFYDTSTYDIKACQFLVVASLNCV